MTPQTKLAARILVGILSLLPLSLRAPIALRAEEGMYPMSELAGLDLKSKGIELTPEQLFNPNGTSLVDGVCRVNGCTGSFVSPKGLIITNHHCAYGAIQKASTADNDYLLNGFMSESLGDEIPAPDYTVRVTEDYRDVSAEVLSVVTSEMTFLERTKAIEKQRKQLEAAAEKEHAGLRAEVAEMFAGKTYVLFLYTYLKDIRLVFAPPQSIGNFGGETDNWMWPRHTGDFSFMRAYTAPDGTSATYSPENVPFQPKRFIQVAPEGVEENDAVFLLGYPGRTARHKTASFLKYEQDVRLPMIVELYNWQIDVMKAAGDGNREVEIKHASRMRSLSNVEKRSRGQLKGLIRKRIVQTRSDAESKLQEFIALVPERNAKYGTLLGELDSVYAQMSREAELETLLRQLTTASRVASVGYFLYDSAVERQMPDLERESLYMDRNWQQSVGRIRTSLRDFHAPTDAMLLGGILDRLRACEGVSSIDALKPLVQDEANVQQLAGDLIATTKLGDAQFVEDCLLKSPAELAEVDDPLLQFLIRLYPTYSSIREAGKTRDGQLGRLYGSLVAVKQEYLSTRFVPDANATLRFTVGSVRRYSPEDAVVKTPITTLSGVVDKTTGIAPFITPIEVIQKYNAQEFGRYRNERLGDVPVGILYDTDTTGGNSGSPIFNAKGQLVGVNFDRCFEATINDFAWDQSYSRSIGVDIRYVLWITEHVYGARHLISEMGIKD